MIPNNILIHYKTTHNYQFIGDANITFKDVCKMFKAIITGKHLKIFAIDDKENNYDIYIYFK